MVRNLPMGFETWEKRYLLGDYLEFETSLWDLKLGLIVTLLPGLASSKLPYGIWNFISCSLKTSGNSVRNFPMGFETLQLSAQDWLTSRFETSLWDLKPQSDETPGSLCVFETSLWDLKPSKEGNESSENRVRNLPMGFETRCAADDVSGVFRSKPPYGIWNPALFFTPLEKTIFSFETSLWDLKRSNFKEFIQKAVRLQHMQADGWKRRKRGRKKRIQKEP